MATATDYSALITSQHRGKPKFTAMVEAVAGCFAGITNAHSQIVQAFDLDSAIGNQLDIIGEWVGLSRYISTPLAVYFSLDIPGLGLDQGIIKGPYDPSQGLTRLDDETYRTMLRGKIAANNWDGTMPSLQLLLDSVFVGTGTLAFASDNQDMTMSIYLAGKIPDALQLGMITSGYLHLKPAGVRMNCEMTSVSWAPIFGLDVQNAYISGLDFGALSISADDFDLSALPLIGEMGKPIKLNETGLAQ